MKALILILPLFLSVSAAHAEDQQTTPPAADPVVEPAKKQDASLEELFGRVKEAHARAVRRGAIAQAPKS